MKKTMLVAMAVLALVAVPAVAGHGEKGEWELGAYAGYGLLDGYDILHPDDGPIFGARVGYFFTPRFSLEGSWQTLDSETNLRGGSGVSDFDFDIISTRLNLLWNLKPGETFSPFVTAGLGVEKADAGDAGDSSDPSINVGGGLRWYLTDHVGVRVDGRYVALEMGRPYEEHEANFEGTVGVLFTLGGGPAPDSDNDGVPDRKDKCPATPVGAKVDVTGCPVDTDGDGVFDGLDKCPDTPKGWPVDAAGCPRDTDGDGVVDGNDSCPDSPKGAKVDAKGCTLDTDGDGVFDGLDRCADTPRGVKVDAYGCPIDNDHDGVFDGPDQCPGTRHGAKVDEKGCEIIEKAPELFPMGQKNLVLEGVNFNTSSADITPEAAMVLEHVAKSLKDWPEVKVEIGGHTDSNGPASANQELSARRAVSVKAYLEAKGIDGARMTTKGYGEAKPLGDNATADGKRRNRRVELTKVD